MSQVDLVSVIIPSYNYGAYLADTIASLQSQDYKHWEAIVVDDGSTDDTAAQVAVLAQQDARVIYIHQHNQGVSTARNAGIARARGEFVLFLDADDLLSPSKLHAHIEHFRRCAAVDISYSKFRYFSDANPDELFTNYRLDSLREWSRSITGYGEEAFPVFIRKNNLPLPAAMFRRALLQRVGYFDSDMRALEDWDYFLRCILRGACMAGVDESAAMVLIRVHSGSATRNIAFVEYMERVYENVRIEIARLRVLGNEGAADSYTGFLQDTLIDLGRRRARRDRKIRQQKIMDSIRDAGVFDFIELYPVIKKWRFRFLEAYFRVFFEKITAIFWWWH
ncbi:MAG: glycosyltransferase [Pseudomonas sp.]|uniref:glycosyltransferase family 2 protein n=1 Tax=Pseudomonas sp. TaxID=306 RepID=UPI00273455F6|nr:glycosyltransferase [Pseudomonas sp.]MDP3845676.1 glycosyltransferase [Pseudomonas sp.]